MARTRKDTKRRIGSWVLARQEKAKVAPHGTDPRPCCYRRDHRLHPSVPGRGERMRLSGRDRVLLLGPLGVLLSAFLVIPSVLGFLATFTSYAPGLSAIRFTALDNYAAVVRDPEFLAAIRNIGLLTVVAVPAELAIGFGLASLMRQPFRGRALCRVLLLMPWLVSPIANGVMWHYLLG